MDFYRPHCKPACPPEVATLVYTCIRSNPNSRHSAEDVCGHLRAVLTLLAPPAPLTPRGHDAHAPLALLSHEGPPGESDIRAAAAHPGQPCGRGEGPGHTLANAAAAGHAAASTGVGVGPGHGRPPVPPPGIQSVYLAGPHSARHSPAALTAASQHAQHGLHPPRSGGTARVVAHDEEREKRWEQRDFEDEKARAADRVGENWFNPQAVPKDEEEQVPEVKPVPVVVDGAEGGEARQATQLGCLQKLLGSCFGGTR